VKERRGHLRIVEAFSLAKRPGGRSTGVCSELPARPRSYRRNNETRPPSPLHSGNDDHRIPTRLVTGNTRHSQRLAQPSHARNATRQRTRTTLQGQGRLVQTDQILQRPSRQTPTPPYQDADGRGSRPEGLQD